MLPPLIQSSEQLEKDLKKSEELFRTQRLEEDPTLYGELYELHEGEVADLLELTVDLTRLEQNAAEIASKPKLLDAVRYLSGPPISADDLKVVAQVDSLNSTSLRRNAPAMAAILSVIRQTLDKRRFPFASEGREADEKERESAIAATAALIASQRIETSRRTKSKVDQERAVSEALATAGLTKVNTRHVQTFADAPAAGSFCAESKLGIRKADFILTLWDNRLMPIECKVSNSSTNSVKRLNNDAAVKAVRWVSDFGTQNVIPTAVLSGVYKLHNLVDAQEKKLTIFWEHNLDELVQWINQTQKTKGE